MTKAKTTKRALFASVLSLLVCVSMLVGSTFAWFTDTASTSVNTIVSGKLDVQLVDKDGNSLEGQTLDFIKAAGAATGEEILWEPGCTYYLPAVYVKNNGNLALKYQIIISGINGDAKLNEAIEWTVTGTDDGRLAAGATSGAISISGHMKEEAGNEYQGLSIEGIAITVIATQDAVEHDSYNNTYDSKAPDLTDENGNVIINDIAALFSFANKVNAGDNYAGKTVLLNADIDLKGTTWTPVGNVNAYPGVTFAGTFDGQGHTISNMYAVDKTVNYASAGFFGSITGKVQNLTIDKATVVSSHYAGGIVGYSSANVGMEVKNCKVLNSTIISAPELIDGGWDNGDKAGGIIGYMVSGDLVGGCTVQNTVVDAYRDLGGVVGYSAGTVTGNTVENITLKVNSEHNYKNYTEPSQNDAGAVIGENHGTESNNTYTGIKTPVEGVEGLYSDGNGSYGVASSEALKAVETAADKTTNIQLQGDIDMGGAKLESIFAGYAGTIEFDGNGNTITNITPVTDGSNGMSNVGMFSSQAGTNITIKNVTIESSNVTVVASGNYGSAFLLGYNEGDVTFENVTIKNSSMTGDNVKIGLFVGYSTGNVTIKNCTVVNSTCGGRYGTCLVGQMNSGKTLTIENVTKDSSVAYCGNLLASSKVVVDGVTQS